MPSSLTWCQGSKLRPSCLFSKLFNIWTIDPASLPSGFIWLKQSWNDHSWFESVSQFRFYVGYSIAFFSNGKISIQILCLVTVGLLFIVDVSLCILAIRLIKFINWNYLSHLLSKGHLFPQCPMDYYSCDFLVYFFFGKKKYFGLLILEPAQKPKPSPKSGRQCVPGFSVRVLECSFYPRISYPFLINLALCTMVYSSTELCWTIC